MNQSNAKLWEEYIPGGCHWSGILRRGTTLRLTDETGSANAAVLFYNLEEKLNGTTWPIPSSPSTLFA